MARNQAIVIGINQYEFLQPLRYAKQDARLMQQFLLSEAKFDRVFFFSDDSPPIAGKSTRPFRANLRQVLREIFAQPFLGDGDNFWFFFSGHGMRSRERDFLMPLDGDPHDIENTGIEINLVSEYLRHCGADNVVLMLDACRNEGTRAGEGIGSQTAETSRQTGVISIFSCSPNQFSYEFEAISQGAFTKALLEGLGIQGRCSTVERLSHYLEHRVPEIVKSYNPRSTQTPYTIAEPITKSHLILMPSYATLQDAELLKKDALNAEVKKDYEIARRLWIRVLAVSPADSEAIKAIERLAQQKVASSSSPDHPSLEVKAPQLPPPTNPAQPRKSANPVNRPTPSQEPTQRNPLPTNPAQPRRSANPVNRSTSSQELTRRDLLKWLTFGGVGVAIAAFIGQLFKSTKFPTDAVITVNSKGQETNRRSIQPKSNKKDLGSGIVLEMVEIPGGKLFMGSPESDKGRSDDEIPPREVTVAPFQMGKFEVTQAQWKAVADLSKIKIDLNPDPSKFKGTNRPVENVSWNEVVEFCDRLSRKTGKQYRLPSEAEWEYACRARTTTPFYFGETITTDLVNYNGNDYPYDNASPKLVKTYREQTTDVGSFPPNAFGLYDMHGNVWEWCADPWHKNYDRAPSDGRVWELESDRKNSLRLLRGGSWGENPGDCRSAVRIGIERNDRNYHIGFRVALSSPRIP